MYKKFLVVLGFILVSVAVYAATISTGDKSSKVAKITSKPNKEAIIALIRQNSPLAVEDIKSSVLPGFAEVFTEQGVVYVSNDGQFLIPGTVYQNQPQVGLVDIAERHFVEKRLAGVARFAKDMIVYPAEQEKYVVNVFTDITCGYCRQLHSQIEEYNKLGITVRYLAYPRYGIRGQDGQLTQSYQDLRSIWCSKDPAKALTDAKAGKAVTYAECDAPIEAQFKFGQEIGVNGTPGIILPNGQLLPGYRDPASLAMMLESL